MDPLERGYYEAIVDTASELEYSYLLDGKASRPDPASRHQPYGVHGRSRVVLPSSGGWHDGSWNGVPQTDLVIYELHVGTFSREGTFQGVIHYLDYLKELGITAIELMPVAQFPGTRNWGYDGVDLFAPQNSYGGPEGLKELVDRCHQKGIAAILDVVYNHVGPEGNYLPEFGPYFSYKYKTPWGAAINYDESGSDEVRAFVVQNACFWIQQYHFDGLRLDAVDRIFDYSPKNVLLEISEAVHEIGDAQGRDVFVIGESDFNDVKIIRPREIGGYGLDAQWGDDFQHSVHAYVTGEKFSHYKDFGTLEDVAKSLSSAFVYDGRYSIHRQRTFGAPTDDISGKRFVYNIQNHDQVGNHPNSERLSALVGFEKLKLEAALLILSQSIPLIFMGQEYSEKAPFFYFVSHSEEKLVNAVREGRRKEREHEDLEREFVDPQSESTFERSKLDHSLRSQGLYRKMLEYYRDIIKLRSSLLPFKNFRRDSQEILLLKDKKVIIMNRRLSDEEVRCIFSMGDHVMLLENPVNRGFRKVFDSTTYTDTPVADHPSEGSDAMILLRPYSATVFAK